MNPMNARRAAAWNSTDPNSPRRARRRRVSFAPLALGAVAAMAGCSSSGGTDDVGSSQDGLRVSDSQAMIWAHQAGIPCDGSNGNLVIAGAIAIAESGLNTDAQGPNGPTSGCPNGSLDRGVWQINNCYHPDVSDGCAYDGACNARAMFSISGGGRTWTPWSTFNNGAYVAHLAEARASYAAACNAPPPPPAGPDFYVLAGDWNGDGVKTPGTYDVHTHEWSLSNFDAASGVAYQFGWGGDGFVPVVGDWDGNETDTPGLYNPTTHQWRLSNKNGSNGVDVEFGWGGDGNVPLAGDWNGDGVSTPGLYNPTTHVWTLSNHNASGGFDAQFGWGGNGTIPVVGDWNGDKSETPGLYNPTTHGWVLSNHNSSGGVDYQFGWGGDGELPVVGDWDKNGTATPGLFNPHTHGWGLSDVNGSNGVNVQFGWGGNGRYTVVGGPVLGP